MQPQIILHIPHSSTLIPFHEGYVVEQALLKEEIIRITDWYTDDLFYSNEDIMLVAPFSRIFCDVERFSEDEHEVMASVGMGVLYEKNDVGDSIRKVSPDLRTHILKNYYWEHHKQLSVAVADQLKQFGKALIIDCHSYPSKPLKRDLHQGLERPDYNIGTDSFHTSQPLIDHAVSFFEQRNLTLGIDWPYRGSIVPMEYYQKNKKVQTIMLEINRALYLNEPGNEKSTNYSNVKKTVSEFIQSIKNSI